VGVPVLRVRRRADDEAHYRVAGGGGGGADDDGGAPADEATSERLPADDEIADDARTSRTSR